MNTLSLIITMILHSLIKASETCFSYTCSKTESNQCSNHKINESIITLHTCPNKEYCDYQQIKDIQVENNSQCRYNTYEYNQPSFPGGPCETALDCLSWKCENKLCLGSVSECKSSKDCNPGFYCNENKCTKLKIPGEDCVKDEECNYNSVCNNNKCTVLLSLKKGSEVKPNNIYLCEGLFIVHDRCVDIQLFTDSTCEEDENCRYWQSEGGEIIVENSCQCSISTNPKKVCRQGNKENIYIDKIFELIKEAISDENTKHCNASEQRGHFCRTLQQNNWDFRNKQILLNKYLLLKDYSNFLDESVPCALNTVFKFDETPPSPRDNNFKCPTYYCGKSGSSDVNNTKFDNNTCAYSVNPFNEEGNGINIYIQDDLCQRGYFCNFSANGVLSNWTYNATCAETETSKKWTFKYPGEECTSHLQCVKSKKFSDVGYCIDGICSGHDSGEECVEHGDCKKGKFCNGLYCESQKGQNYFCLESFECLNYLGCWNNTCVPYYSLSNGTYLNSTNPDATLCKMGKINKNTNQCAELDYYEKEKIKDKTPDGFIPCTPGQWCNYTTGYYSHGKLVVETQKCQCGYNLNGLAYCPIPQSVNVKDWKEYYHKLNKKWDNDCHTLRRNECSEQTSEKEMNNLGFYSRKTVKAHWFYDSSNCIIQVLGSRYTSQSTLLMLLLSWLLFI